MVQCKHEGSTVVYHLAISNEAPETPLCAPEFWRARDAIVPRDEADDPEGRHYNCVNCHKELTGGYAHVANPLADVT